MRGSVEVTRNENMWFSACIYLYVLMVHSTVQVPKPHVVGGVFFCVSLSACASSVLWCVCAVWAGVG